MVTDWGGWDERAHGGEIRHLAWVLELTLRVATAPTPAEVHRALQALAGGGVEPSRHTIRIARTRLRELARASGGPTDGQEGGRDP